MMQCQSSPPTPCHDVVDIESAQVKFQRDCILGSLTTPDSLSNVINKDLCQHVPFTPTPRMSAAGNHVSHVLLLRAFVQVLFVIYAHTVIAGVQDIFAWGNRAMKQEPSCLMCAHIFTAEVEFSVAAFVAVDSSVPNPARFSAA